MSSREDSAMARPGRRHALALMASALMAAPLVSACQPLYGKTPSGTNVKDAMAAVNITEVPGRVGQRVRNELIFATTSGGYAAEPRYRLDITVREWVTNTLVTLSGTTTGQIFNLDAKFKLVRLADNKVMFEGKAVGRAAYDRPEVKTPAGKTARANFANVRAERDAENRAAREVASTIRTRVAAFLSTEA